MQHTHTHTHTHTNKETTKQQIQHANANTKKQTSKQKHKEAKRQRKKSIIGVLVVLCISMCFNSLGIWAGHLAPSWIVNRSLLHLKDNEFVVTKGVTTAEGFLRP